MLDINECTTNNGGCLQTCTNTSGSFVCSCMAGYTLDSDSRSCNGKQLQSNDVNLLLAMAQLNRIGARDLQALYLE